MKLDILVFAAHPDDAELSCSGTIIKHIKAGYQVGVIDLTRGELGTRGNADTRAREAEKATRIMGLAARENLGMADGFFDLSMENKLRVITMIRKYRPEIILANAVTDRHPDHGRASQLISESCFLSGLIRITTIADGESMEAWRPKAVYHYIQDRRLKPDLIVDISDCMEQRMEAIMAFSSQFYNPESLEPETAISQKNFLEYVRTRALEMGRLAGVEFGEGFTTERPPGTKDLLSLI